MTDEPKEDSTDTTEDTETDGQGTRSDDGVEPAGTVELQALLDAQYGDRFDTERREELRDSVASLRKACRTVNEADLENSDEPAFTFAAYRGDE